MKITTTNKAVFGWMDEPLERAGTVPSVPGATGPRRGFVPLPSLPTLDLDFRHRQPSLWTEHEAPPDQEVIMTSGSATTGPIAQRDIEWSNPLLPADPLSEEPNGPPSTAALPLSP